MDPVFGVASSPAGLPMAAAGNPMLNAASIPMLTEIIAERYSFFKRIA
jgi:hypothetical protein